MLLLRRGLPVTTSVSRHCVRALSSAPSKPPLDSVKGRSQPEPRTSDDAFSKGLPFLFRNNLTLSAMVTLLGMIFVYHAITDMDATAEEVLPADVEKVRAAPLRTRALAR
jgi:hypothetical protein